MTACCLLAGVSVVRDARRAWGLLACSQMLHLSSSGDADTSSISCRPLDVASASVRVGRPKEAS